MIFIPTYKTEFVDACILEVEAGTTGNGGGDSGHGGRTILRMKDLGGTDIRSRELRCGVGLMDHGIEIIVGGDAERRLLIRALRWAADVIEFEHDPDGHQPVEGAYVE